MQHRLCPILIVTASVPLHYDSVFKAMGAGLIEAISVPANYHGGSVQGTEILLKKIALLGFSSQRLLSLKSPFKSESKGRGVSLKAFS
jgi:hypothetical protein